jgi:hypothetical protein
MCGSVSDYEHFANNYFYFSGKNMTSVMVHNRKDVIKNVKKKGKAIPVTGHGGP